VSAVLHYFSEHAAEITARIQANRVPDSIQVS
jgi:hypothetical protein